MESGFLIFILFTNLLVPFSSGKSNGVCVSQGGRFPPFREAGKPPRKVSRGPKDLTLCRVFRKKTCCDVTQTHFALLSIRRLASTGEASNECLHLWELLECAICDPSVSVQPGPPNICPSLCNRVYEVCSNAYFSVDAKTQVLAPCGVNDFVCGRAAEWVHNGTELCRAAGFGASNVYYGAQLGAGEMSCYGGKASLDSISDSWQTSQFEAPQRGENLGLFEDFLQWLKGMTFSKRVSWAVGGMVLTAGVLFMSKRKSDIQRQKLAAIRRAARKLEARMTEQQQSSTRGNRRGSKR